MESVLLYFLDIHVLRCSVEFVGPRDGVLVWALKRSVLVIQGKAGNPMCIFYAHLYQSRYICHT